jgi:hypothetical protein
MLGKGFSALSLAATPLKMLGSVIGKVAGGLLRIGQIAAGIILAAVFQKAVTAVMNFGRAIGRAVERMQTLRIQIGTLTARELSKSINASIEQAVVWRGMTRDGEMLSFNIEKLKESVKGYEDVLRTADPALGKLLDSTEKYGRVVSENVGVWVSTADAFEAAIPLTKSMMNELAKIAIISPFTIDATNNMFRMASAMGFTGKQALNITKGMLNVAAGLGLTNEQAQRLVLNFSQIRSQGKITQRDIREMSLTGFQMADVFQEMNRTLGLSIQGHEDFNDALRAGKFTWAEFTSSFESLADRQFGESARRMATTIQGIKSSISDIVTISADRILGPTADAFGGVFDTILDGFTDIVESGELDEIGAEIERQTQTWLATFGTFKTRLENLGLVQALRGLASEPGISEEASDVIGGVATSLERIGAALDLIKGTKSGISEIFDMIKAITGGPSEAKSELSMGGIRGITEIPVDQLMPKDSALSGPINSILEIWQRLRDWWDENGPGISAGIDAVVTLFEGTFAGAAESLGGAMDNITEAFQLFKDNVDWDTVQLILGAVGGLLLGLAVGGITLVAGIISGISAAFLAFVETLVTLKDDLTGIGESIIKLFEEGISLEAIGDIVAGIMIMVANLFGGVGEIILGFIDSAINTIGSVASGIAEAFGQEIEVATVNLSAGWTTLKDTIIGLIKAARSKVWQAGADFIKGLWDGIKSKVQPMLDWLRKKAQEIIDLWDSIFGNKSPSKVMQRVGKDITDGLAVGLTKGMDNVDKKTKTAITGTIGGTQPKLATDILAQVSTDVPALDIPKPDLATAARSQTMSVLTETGQDGSRQQIAAEEATRTVLAEKLDQLLVAISATGDADEQARALSEALQTADLA